MANATILLPTDFPLSGNIETWKQTIKCTMIRKTQGEKDLITYNDRGNYGDDPGKENGEEGELGKILIPLKT